MREAFRLNKHDFYGKLDSRNEQIAVMFVFIGKKITDYSEIEKGMKSALSRILKML